MSLVVFVKLFCFQSNIMSVIQLLHHTPTTLLLILLVNKGEELIRVDEAI